MLLALTIGFQVFQVIDASIGSSLSLGTMITEFNYSILQDLFNVHGASLSPLIGKLRWYILLYLVFSAFISAGIWHALTNSTAKEDWSMFWTGGSAYFGKFLLIGIGFLLLFIIWSALIWGPYFISFFNMMETWLNDSHIIWLGLFLFLIWIHGVAFFFVWSSYLRAALVNEEAVGVWRLVYRTHKLAWRRYFRILPSLWLFALIIFLLYFVVIFLESNIGITSVGLILGFLLLQQLVIWLKIIHRIGAYRFLLEDYRRSTETI